MKTTTLKIVWLASLLVLAIGVLPSLAHSGPATPVTPPAIAAAPSPADAGTGGASKAAPAKPAAVKGPGTVRTEVVAESEFGDIARSGNQLFIREYDRRIYQAGDIRRLQVDHFAKEGMFKFLLSNPLTDNWTDMNMRWHGDELNARFNMSFLTHNIGTEFQSLIIDGQRQLMFPLQTTNDAAGDARVVAGEGNFNPNVNRRDVDLGFQFYLNRQEYDARLDWGHVWDKRLRLSYWAEHEYGLPEITGPSRREIVGFGVVEHPQTSFAHPVDRLAEEFEVGGDGRIEKVALYGTYFTQKIDDDTPDLVTLIRAGGDKDLRPGLIVFPERSGDGFRGGMSFPIGDDAKIRFNHVARERRNARSGYEVDFDTFTASADWDPGRNWAVFSQFRDYRRSTTRNEAFLPTDSVNILPLNPPAVVNEDPRQGIFDESNDEFEMGFRYSGWKNHNISGGYKHESIKQPNDFRDANALTRFSGDQTGHLDYLRRGVDNRLLATNPSLSRDGLWLKTNATPSKKLQYRTSSEYWNSNKDFMTRGTAQDERNLSVDAFYDFEPNLQGYLEVQNNDHKGNEEPYEDTFKSFTLGAQGQAGRWGVGGSLTHETFHTTYVANWQQPLAAIGGNGRVRGFLTGVEFSTNRNDVFNLSLTPPRTANDRLQCEMNFTLTDSRGYQPVAYYNTAFSTRAQDIFIAGTRYDDANAVDVKISRLALRGEYDLRAKQKSGTKSDDVIGLDLSHGRWKDDVDFRQTGDFTSAWLTYRHRL